MPFGWWPFCSRRWPPSSPPWRTTERPRRTPTPKLPGNVPDGAFLPVANGILKAYSQASNLLRCQVHWGEVPVDVTALRILVVDNYRDSADSLTMLLKLW